MDSIINFIINCILSVSDLFLINFFIFKSIYRNDSIKKYLKINLCNLICFIFLIYINFSPPNLILNSLATVIILVLLLLYNQYLKVKNIKVIINYIVLKLLIHFISHITFSWIFDTQLNLFYSNYLNSYITLVLFVERYLMYSILLLHFNYLTTKILHHFKVLSIILFIYFCSVFIINNNELFYFPIVGRTFIFVMFVSIASSIFFDRYQVKHEKIEKDLAIQTQNILKEKEYIYKRISVDEKERKMRHDVRNNLDIVYGYLRDKKYEKAEDLVKELLGVVEERDALIHIGNVSIDSVIDDKLSLAKEKNIIYEENAKNMYYGDIEINELALLIGLALDNAIEACEKVEENRYIYFEARNKKDYLVIHITNSIIPHTKPRFYKTSKLVDKMNHGFGVEEIKDIVKRYDGDIQYDTKEDRVILRIILKTKKD